MRTKSPIFFRPLLCGLLLLVAACSGNQRQDPILRLSAAEALEQGKAQMEAEKFFRARRLLTHAFEVEPNSRTGREALLLAADALYQNGGPDNYVKCEARYRDFLNRFPTSERADYAQFQVANCLFQRMEKPDRDQQASHQAIAAYQELIRLYPTSEYTTEARQQIAAAGNNLAAAELIIGKFYFRYGLCSAAIQRLAPVGDDHPSYGRMDEVLFWLSLANLRCDQSEEAATARQALEQEHPDSPWIAELDQRQTKVLKKLAKDKKKYEERRRAFDKQKKGSS